MGGVRLNAFHKSGVRFDKPAWEHKEQKWSHLFKSVGKKGIQSVLQVHIILLLFAQT